MGHSESVTGSVTGRLEHWMREQISSKEFIIWGTLYNDVHGRWEEGKWVHTSGILNRECNEGDIVQTRNSTYLLGVPFHIPEEGEDATSGSKHKKSELQS